MYLAETIDVEVALGRSLTAAEADRANTLIVLATAAAEARTGWRFAPGAYTTERLVRSGKVRIPGNVAAVSEVRSIDQYDGSPAAVTGWTLRGNTLYRVPGSHVEVDFTVTAAVPEEIVALIAGVTAATIASPPVGTAQQTAGPFTVSYADSSGRVWFSASDKLILSKYKGIRSAMALL